MRLDDNSSPPTRSGAVETVLVIEDDTALAMLLCFIVEREGFRTERASDGRAALQFIATQEPPALILLDILLPFADGFEILGTIRANHEWGSVPVLMLSSKGTERDISRAFDAGADGYLVKPFQPEELQARIHYLARKNHE